MIFGYARVSMAPAARWLGRSLKELIHLVNEFQQKGIGFMSLHDAIDTTTAQGRLIFNIFASLAEFDRTAAADGRRTEETSFGKEPGQACRPPGDGWAGSLRG